MKLMMAEMKGTTVLMNVISFSLWSGDLVDYLNEAYDYSHCEEKYANDDRNQYADRDGYRFLKNFWIGSLRRGFGGPYNRDNE